MGGNSNDDYAKDAQRLEAARRAEIEKGTRDVRQLFDLEFTPEFYQKQQDQFLNYYRPQLERQVNESNRQLSGGLARGENFGGMIPELDPDTGAWTGRYTNREGGGNSTAIRKFDDLQIDHNTKRAELVDRARESANDRRGAVQSAKEGVIAQLQSTADASGASADAASRAAVLNQPEAYEPLGQVFTDTTFGLATQADLERRGTSKYDTGFFPKNSSSGENVG